MTLSEKYQQAIRLYNMQDDPAQQAVITQLQALSDELLNPGFSQRLRMHFPAVVSFCAFSRWFNFNCLTQPVAGIYLWGDVGRGKTWLIHLFYDNLAINRKKRLHFHAFMQSVHEQLAEMKKQKNPLNKIARNFALNYRLLCLDEFIVTNITDAMLLAGLLEAFFKYGVTLVATSNRVPDDLYLNGLQRDRFLPAINLIKTHCRILHLDAGVDHRLALLERSHLYYFPLGDENEQLLKQQFISLCAGDFSCSTTLTLFNRAITTVYQTEGIIWFDFNVICVAPRAAQDYVEIAQRYHSVFISAVPVMDETSDDKARRFIYLIDALYDNKVKLFINAETTPEKLYRGNMLEFAFKRTCSRLIEMRSEQYLSQAHHPQADRTSNMLQ